MFLANINVFRLGQLMSLARFHLRSSFSRRANFSTRARIQGKDLLDHVRAFLPAVKHGSHRSLADFKGRVLPEEVDKVVRDVKKHVLKFQEPDEFYPEVVISYATGGSIGCHGPGKLLAAYVIDYLENNGISSYSDLFTHQARMWRNEYTARLNDKLRGKAKVVVALLTDKFFESRFCLEEIQLAIDSNVAILPFRVEQVPYSEQDWWTEEWLDAILTKEGSQVGTRQYELCNNELRCTRMRVRNVLKAAHIPYNSNMLDDETALLELVTRTRQELGPSDQSQDFRSFRSLCELEDRILRAIGQDVDQIQIRPSCCANNSFVEATIRVKKEYVNNPAVRGLHNMLVDSHFDGSYMTGKQQLYTTNGSMAWALNEFDNWNKRADTRVYSLVGDPGIGKTTIATRIAKE